MEMMHRVGSTSQSAMKRLWPGLVGSCNRKGETLCWLMAGVSFHAFVYQTDYVEQCRNR